MIFEIYPARWLNTISRQKRASRYIDRIKRYECTFHAFYFRKRNYVLVSGTICEDCLNIVTARSLTYI